SGRSDAQNLSPAVLGSSAKPVQSVALPGISLGGALTLEAWVNLSDISTDGAKIIALEDAGFYGIYLGLKGTSGQISFQAYNDNNTTFLAPSGGLTAGLSYTLSANTWAHVAVTVDSSNTATLYVNGVAAGSVDLSAAIDNHQRPDSFVGSAYGASASTPLLKGKVSDVRIYDSARTAQQIRTDMAGSIAANNPDLRLSYAGPGLGFDLFNFNAPVSGVSAPYASLAPVMLGADLTLALWVNPALAYTSGKTRLLNLGDGQSGSGSHSLALGINSSGKLTFEAYNDASSATALVNLTSTTALTLNTWSHVAVTVNSSQLATLYINGSAAGTFTLTAAISNLMRSNTWVGKSELTAHNAFQGAIADVRIYDYARTLVQIGQDMSGAIDLTDSQLRLATPQMQGTGDWKRTFINVKDTLPSLVITGASGTALSYSTVTASTVASITLPGVRIGGDFTLETWVKPSNLVSGYQIFLNLGDTAASGTATIGKNSIYLAMDGASGNSGKVTFKAYNGGVDGRLNELFSPSTIPLNSWTHVAVTVDSSLTSTLYINGISVSTGTLTSAVSNLLRTKTFVGRGEWSAEPNFQGSLADVRVYDTARTATQIAQDMSGTINTSDKDLRLAYDTPGVKYGVFNLDNQAQTAANQNGVSLPSVVLGGDLTMEIWVNPAKLDSNYAKFLTLSETDLSDNLF
ncbi:MAG: LamG domain-containing protein, partial [Rhodoferax sp.]|nr:LamG domain-containing protein [Rhodoferax sp.]